MRLSTAKKISLLVVLFCSMSVLTQDAESGNVKPESLSYDTYLQSFQKDARRGTDMDRLAQFQRNIKYIRQHNAMVTSSAQHSFSLRMNQFSDLTDDELSTLHPVANHPPIEYRHMLQRHIESGTDTEAVTSTPDSLPLSVNWADASKNPTGRRVVSPVGNQALCGACWAFSAVYATEAAVRLAGKASVSLSVQELLDCDRNGTVGMTVPPLTANNGCSGGNPIRAFSYILKYGLGTGQRFTSNHLIEEQVQKCRIDADHFNWRARKLAAYRSGEPLPAAAHTHTRASGPDPASATHPTVAPASARMSEEGTLASISSFEVVPSGDEARIKDYLGRFGPVTIGICGTDPRFIFYGHGILDISDCCITLNHALLLVGYGTEGGMDYWIAQNSWGTQWGEEGFIRIKRNDQSRSQSSSLPLLSYFFFPSHTGVCGMALSASLPIGGFLLSPSSSSSSSEVKPGSRSGSGGDNSRFLFATLSDWFLSNEANIALSLSGILLLLASFLFIAALRQDHSLWQRRKERQRQHDHTPSSSFPSSSAPLLGDPSPLSSSSSAVVMEEGEKKNDFGGDENNHLGRIGTSSVSVASYGGCQ